MAVGLTAIGKYVPDRVLNNAELEKLVDTSDEWIISRTGISERRIAQPDQFSSDMAYGAVDDLINRYGREVLDGVDMVILATCTPDALLPSTAALVQNRYQLSAAAFDLSAACAGWIYSLSAAYSFIEAGLYKKILVIGTEVLSKIVDWSDRSTCILFGDGAGAGIVESVPDGFGFKSFVLGTDGSNAKQLHTGCLAPHLPDGTELGKKVFMNGREVFKFAVRVMDTATIQALEKAGLTLDDVNLVIPHQANQRIIEAARDRLKLPAEKVFSNLAFYGNTSAASIPIAITEAVEQKKIKDGDHLLLVSFGAGLNWSACVLRWGKG